MYILNVSLKCVMIFIIIIIYLNTRFSINDKATTDDPITTILASIDIFWIVHKRVFMWNNANFSQL